MVTQLMLANCSFVLQHNVRSFHEIVLKQIEVITHHKQIKCTSVLSFFQHISSELFFEPADCLARSCACTPLVSSKLDLNS